MSNHPTWPIFHDHDSAGSWGCFLCKTKINPVTAQDKGYPPGRGKYGMKCPHCGSTSFYDLVKEHPSPDALRCAIINRQLKRE